MEFSAAIWASVIGSAAGPARDGAAARTAMTCLESKIIGFPEDLTHLPVAPCLMHPASLVMEWSEISGRLACSRGSDCLDGRENPAGLTPHELEHS